ncbi:hypothetical protein Ahy_A09g042951 [Arachis hypogaea]|uniref:F-box domain-containing protein n=1 Tax=Arachis hypogaea TaxID=3818 RepID=A0A445BH55_ARAHY|nr:hypothetical protein Ahy_A09g042951 [Arachis hypogaea]
MSHKTELISSSAKAIERHDALLTKILVLLSLRDVMAFKCVSKWWLSLISDPYFSRCHTTIQGTRFSSLILDPDFIDPQHRELTFFYFNMDFAHGVYFKDLAYLIDNKSKTTLCFDLKKMHVKDDLPPLPPGPQDLNDGGRVYLTSLELNSKEAYNGYGYILAPACDYMNLVGFDFEFFFNPSSSKPRVLREARHPAYFFLPRYKKPIGRLATKRDKRNDGPADNSNPHRTKRKYETVVCKYYLEPSHNKRSCKKKKDAMTGGSGVSQEHVSMRDEYAN